MFLNIHKTALRIGIYARLVILFAAHCSDSIVCTSGGFVDQNCKCICPDGIDSCTGSDSSSHDRKSMHTSGYNNNDNNHRFR